MVTDLPILGSGSQGKGKEYSYHPRPCVSVSVCVCVCVRESLRRLQISLLKNIYALFTFLFC